MGKSNEELILMEEQKNINQFWNELMNQSANFSLVEGEDL